MDKAKLNLFILIIFFISNAGAISFPLNAQYEEPFDLILIVDNTGSVNGLDKEAISTFFPILSANNRLGIISFQEDADLIFELQPMGTEEAISKANNAIDQLNFTGKYTSLNAALRQALAIFLRDVNSGESKFVIILSDGNANPSQAEGTEEAMRREIMENILPEYQRNGIAICSVGLIDPYQESNLQFLQEIASRTAGMVTISSKDPKELRDALSLLLGEIEEDMRRSFSAEIPSEVIWAYLFQLILFFALLSALMVFMLKNWKLYNTRDRIANGVFETNKKLDRLLINVKSFGMDETPKQDANTKKEYVEIVHLLAEVGTGLWRIRQKLNPQGTTRPPEDLLYLYRPFESTWDKIIQGGMDIKDHTGDIFTGGEALSVLAFQPSSDLSQDRILETIEPTIFFKGKMIQMGEVIVGKSEGKENQEANSEKPS